MVFCEYEEMLSRFRAPNENAHDDVILTLFDVQIISKDVKIS